MHPKYSNYFLQRSVKYLIIAQAVYGNLFVHPPLGLTIVYFNIDPTYFFFQYAFGSKEFDTLCNQSFAFFIFQGLLRSCLVIELFISLTIRYIAFAIILDCCRIYHYDYILTFLWSRSSQLSSLTLHRLYYQVRLCHYLLNEFFRLFYCIFMVICQFITVLVFWIFVIGFRGLPFLISAFILIIGIQTAVGALSYIEASFRAHQVSDNIVRISRLRTGNVLSKKLWIATPEIKVNCAQYFQISKITALSGMNLILNNLASLILLNVDSALVFIQK